MLENWNKFINEILTNTDNDQPRSVEPIDNDDKKSIVPLGETEAIILWNRYFSDTVKYALKFERTYDEPIMTQIFDESEINPKALKKVLQSMYPDETPVLIYWNIHVAIKTTWGMFIKYWDNFFYSAGDEAIIYINKDDVYIYTDMIVRKINRLKSVCEVSAFDYLQKFEDEKTKKLSALDGLFNGVSSDLQDTLYLIFHQISEGLRVIENDELRKEYLNYYLKKIWANTTNVILACKPYSEESKKDYYTSLEACWDNPSAEKFNEFLKKLIAEKS